MTLDEFIASKRWSDDMGAELPDECWNRDEPPQAGYIYAGQFHIEKIGPDWEYFHRDGEWYLLLGNMEYVDGDLSKLEGILYAYARSEMGWAICKGDLVVIKPEWRDAGDENFTWIARTDEEKGRLDISALEQRHMPIWPTMTVTIAMVQKLNRQD